MDPSSRRAVPDRGSKPKRNQTIKDSKVKTANLIHNLHMRGIRTIHENVDKVFVSVYAITLQRRTQPMQIIGPVAEGAVLVL